MEAKRSRCIGQLAFGIMKDAVHQIISMSDQELIEGMRFFGERMKMVVEPTGCLGMAGLQKMTRNGEIPPGSKRGVLISGGNVDLVRYCAILNS